MRNARKLSNEVCGKNVMFGVVHPWHGWLLAHIKEYVQVNDHYMLAMETPDGCPIIAEYSWLRAIPKREGTPAKHKCKHVKGTKPWLSKFEYVDYDPKIIAPGVRVKCRDKKIRTVENINYYDYGEHVIDFTDGECSFLHSGCANYTPKENPYFCDIMKILVEKKIDKHVHDHYNGYTPNVWHFWQGNTDVPPVDGDVKVEIWCRGNNTWPNSNGLSAGGWYWKWDKCDSDIIAFRIVKDK